MKKLILTFSSVAITAFSMAQSCSPNSSFAGSPAGLYPNGPLGPTCDLTAPKTIVSLTDTTISSPFGPATLYIDVMRVNSVTGLPSGLVFSTDVIGTADMNGPYGYWYNSGTVPNQTSAIGCGFVYGVGGDWDAAIGGGPNNDGSYPLVFEVDARVAGSNNTTLNAFIPAGTWVSDISPSFGGGSFYIYDTLIVASDYADISTTINGSTNVNPGSNYNYQVPNDPNVTYTWSVTNGSIISGQGTNSIIVSWNGSGSVEVDMVDGGCQGTDMMEVTAIATGLDEVSGINASIYPNPNNGLFNLRLENTDGVSVRIIDMSGKLIRSTQLAGRNMYSIDMQNEEAGVYVIEIESETGKTYKRLIKQ